MGRVAEAERSARATEPTTPLDTLGGPLQNLTCAELTLLALLLPQPELLGGAREGLIGQAAQVLFAHPAFTPVDLKRPASAPASRALVRAAANGNRAAVTADRLLVRDI